MLNWAEEWRVGKEREKRKTERKPFRGGCLVGMGGKVNRKVTGSFSRRSKGNTSTNKL